MVIMNDASKECSRVSIRLQVAAAAKELEITKQSVYNIAPRVCSITSRINANYNCNVLFPVFLISRADRSIPDRSVDDFSDGKAGCKYTFPRAAIKTP